MYLSRLKYKDRWTCLVFQPSKYFIRPKCLHACSQSLSRTVGEECSSHGSISRGHLLDSFSAWCIASGNSYTGCHYRSNSCLRITQFRVYSSESDGRNASEDKHMPVNDGANFDKGKSWREKVGKDVKHCDAHARIGEEDQKEWLKNEKLAIESKKRESPFLTRREKFKNEFLRRVIPWEKISLSWETFPYYINKHTKNLLVECVASHLKHKKFTASYGARLTSSSGRILLQGVPGTELYRERLVRALARDLQVPLLVLDSSVLAPYDFGDELSSDSESDDDNAESGEEDSLESDDENAASNEEEWTSSGDVKSDGSDNDDSEMQAAAEEALKKVEAAVKKLAPHNLEEFEKRVSGESESSESSKSQDVEPSDKSQRPLRKGDRVRYVGPSVHNKADDRIILGKILTSDGPTNAYTVIRGRPLSKGQRGVVYEVTGERVGVVLDIGEKNINEGEERGDEDHSKQPLHWIDVKHIEFDPDAQAEDCYIAIEALFEVLHSKQPLIVYFPDSSQWLSRAVPKSDRKEFVQKVQAMFDQLSGPIVLICGQNKVESGSKEKENVTMILPNFGRLAKLPLSLKRLTEGLNATKRSDDNEIYKLFTNVVCLYPPKEEDILATFNKQVEKDRRIVISRSNLNELHKVLEEHELSCMELLQINTDGVILTKQKAEKVVGWAKNHYLSTCTLPSIKGERLCVPRESVEVAISRLMEQERILQKSSQNLKNLAKDEYESNFISAVVAPGEIGVKFDDIGALEEVKKALNELVILPMRRPELFSRGNLLRPCKGILLFGPPGTGKTLLAKALATEAGANFISITGSTLTSKWFGDAEKLTKALFSFASKLAPVIIFVDEVDSLLGARGGALEHEATRRMRNEFMAAWDGLRSKDSQRILILGATNRPFDLDDAVIRRLPRRIYVDLPDAQNRAKILRILLGRETLEPGFQFDKLALLTEGYSGSDLQNLCIAAAYRPVQELLEQERKECKNDTTTILRSLNLDDFVQSKSKVGPSVAYDAASMNELRKWNEQYGEGGSRRKSPFGFGN
ncbi:ATPase family AAA domain-containing protein 1 [Quillaja saponaria]|uniref:ATPase family AAA domain-containing protein 1 n=1 Tax=Quillaja saponaria TaxID=32244 RepID=A0AAD7LAG7_QUISA|nr:ATPase family AAA domain-containing protein 1 [Quillaja saponaria]